MEEFDRQLKVLCCRKTADTQTPQLQNTANPGVRQSIFGAKVGDLLICSLPTSFKKILRNREAKNVKYAILLLFC